MNECVIELRDDIVEKLNNASIYASVNPNSFINNVLECYFNKNGYYDKNGNKVI